jgi:UDP-N-acetyl-D-mannosaminuronate dehydrogenase
VKNTDCIVISTAHQEFKKVDLMKIANLMNSSPIIVDGRRIIKPEQAKRAGIVYYGIGFGKGF